MISEVNWDLWLGSATLQILKTWVENNKFYFQSKNAFDIIARHNKVVLYQAGVVWSLWLHFGLQVKPWREVSVNAFPQSEPDATTNNETEAKL